MRRPTFSSSLLEKLVTGAVLLAFCSVCLTDAAAFAEVVDEDDRAAPAEIILSREALNRHRQQYHLNGAGVNNNNHRKIVSVEDGDDDGDDAETEREMSPVGIQQSQGPPPALMMQMMSAASSRAQRERSLWSEDFRKKAAELCGTSASLECGKRVLSLIEGQEMSELSVHMKCDLRDDFLKCIDTQKRDCLELASKSVLPELPPKEVIKMERSKLWKVLWTAGGCVLAD